MFRVKIHLLTTSMPISYDKAKNCYVKDQMYCVMFLDEYNNDMVHKYPITNIFRVIEDYNQQ